MFVSETPAHTGFRKEWMSTRETEPYAYNHKDVGAKAPVSTVHS